MLIFKIKTVQMLLNGNPITTQNKSYPTVRNVFVNQDTNLKCVKYSCIVNTIKRDTPNSKRVGLTVQTNINNKG